MSLALSRRLVSSQTQSRVRCLSPSPLHILTPNSPFHPYPYPYPNPTLSICCIPRALPVRRSLSRHTTGTPEAPLVLGYPTGIPRGPGTSGKRMTSGVMVAMAASGTVTEAQAGASPLLPADEKALNGQPGYSGQLKKVEELKWENTFVDELPGETNTANNVRIVRNSCYSLARPSLNLQDPQLVAASTSAALECLQLDPQEFQRPDFPTIFSGGIVPQGCKPYAQCYGGHQFGSWAGQLGDGRAITIGEVVPDPKATQGSIRGPGGDLGSEKEGESGTGIGMGGMDGERWEVQFKGVGKTPYSRHADGRAVLRSSIREFLCSEAMHALGVPTTRALSVVATGEQVLRDMFYNGNAKMEPGAAVCRLAPSFIRFGSFQLPVSRGGMEKELAKRLADYAIRHHFPHLAHLPEYIPEEPQEKKEENKEGDTEEEDADNVDTSTNKYAAWFAEVAERTGRLVAGWQSVGFTHGVLNTDNMSILGLTIDYGPFGFLDEFDPNYTPNTTDMPGRRYCFQNQPDIGMWNVVQLANALHTGGLISVPQAQHAVSRYAKAFVSEYERRMAAKVGLESYNKELTQALLNLMAKHSVDFTNTFRALGDVPLLEKIPEDGVVCLELLEPLRNVLGLEPGDSEPSDLSDAALAEESLEWSSMLKRIVAKVIEEQGGKVTKKFEEQRRESMRRANPKYILRNYLCQNVIEAAEAGDFQPTRRLLAVLENPYDDQEGAEEFCQAAPKWAKRPGVCMLSCSS